MKDQPKISVLIALDDHSKPEITMPSLTNQSTTDDYEIIIVNGNPRFRWENRFKQATGSNPDHVTIRYFEIENAGRASCWNLGVSKAKADFFLFFADDFSAANQLVEEHIKFHNNDPSEFVVGIGPTFFPDSIRQTPFIRWLEDSGSLFGVSFTESPETNIADTFFWGANASMKRGLFYKTGKFDERFPYHAWDDYEFGLRLVEAGMRSRYLPDAISYHHHHINIAERMVTMRNAGQSAAIFERIRPGSWPWHATVGQKPLKLKILACYKRLRYLLFRRECMRWNSYQLFLDSAFSLGYRMEKQKDNGDHPVQ